MAGTGRVEGLFKGRQFDQGIIVLCVRWYLRYKLSTRDLGTINPFGALCKNSHTLKIQLLCSMELV
jgi:hypothetical protein